MLMIYEALTRLRKRCNPCLLSVTFVFLPARGDLMCQSNSQVNATCSKVNNLSGNPLSRLPKQTQAEIKKSIAVDFRTIAHDPGMGLENVDIDTAELNAVPITSSSASGRLYVVAWDDRSFGVNGFNWVVDVTPSGARSLMHPLTPSPKRWFSGGFGVEVLDGKNARYPEVMFASKGFAVGGGAEAEVACFHKVGSFYESLSCPATCHQTLNAR